MKNQLPLPLNSENKKGLSHGGSLKNLQKRKRPLTIKSSNHFVLRSSHAKGGWSFRRHKKEIGEILVRFSRKHHIGIRSYANVGNHIHLNIEISNRNQYRKFIRAISSAIMICVTGYSRWNKAPDGFQFWDYRPFSRVITSWTEVLSLEKYILKNKFEGEGFSLLTARKMAGMAWRWEGT